MGKPLNVGISKIIKLYKLKMTVKYVMLNMDLLLGPNYQKIDDEKITTKIPRRF